MGLTSEWDIERTWGSHQALLKAVLEVLEPFSAIECGCGNFSTPFLQQAVPVLTTIEHDVRWASMLKAKLPAASHNWILKAFKAKNATRISELPPEEFDSICEYYGKLATELDQVDLLFVDTFTACRVPATLSLGTLAKHIIIHDLEPPGPVVYEWARLDEFLKTRKKYIHMPMGQIGGRHQIPWTGLFSLEELPLDDLNKAMEPESRRLWDSFTPLARMADD